jgi:hypothetical protein
MSGDLASRLSDVTDRNAVAFVRGEAITFCNPFPREFGSEERHWDTGGGQAPCRCCSIRAGGSAVRFGMLSVSRVCDSDGILAARPSNIESETSGDGGNDTCRLEIEISLTIIAGSGFGFGGGRFGGGRS